MAQALAQRARQLSRTSKSLAGGVLELQSAMRALNDAKLLPEDEASVLPFIDRRISEILQHEGQLLSRRPGRPRARPSAASPSAELRGRSVAPLPTAPLAARPEESSALADRWWGLVNEREQQRRPTSA